MTKIGTFGENVGTALWSLRANWLRTSLTMLGVVIGVGSVALLVSIGLGVQKEVTDQVLGLGSNLVFIVPGKLERNAQPNPIALLGVSSLTTRDVESLAAQPGVYRVAPFMFVSGTVEHEGRAFGAFVVGTTSAFSEIRPRPLAEGEFFSERSGAEAVCVLAQQPRAAIFGDGAALGKTLVVQGVPFRVVGTLKDEPESALLGGAGFESMIFLPARVVAERVPRAQINRILLQTNPALPPEQVLGAIHRTLLENHRGREDFGVLTQKQLLRTIYRLMEIVTALLGGLSAISLVVAGIGIMNIMLVTVTERTHEIGIRKTVGARRVDIFTQFLLEAVTISSFGGVLGVALAAGLCVAVARFSPLHPLLTLRVVAIAFGVCFAVGIVFGTVPAMRAARQDPIAAMRYE